MRKAEFTEKVRSASTMEPDFTDPELSVFDVEVSPLLVAGVAEGLVRTRSAQDFGFGGEDTVTWPSFSASPASLFKEANKLGELCVASDEDVCVPGRSCVFSGVSSFVVVFCEVVGCVFG
jgi:hypothetical protein